MILYVEQLAKEVKCPVTQNKKILVSRLNNYWIQYNILCAYEFSFCVCVCYL